MQNTHGILRKIRRYLSKVTATLIYKVMIRPHYDYGDYMIDSGSKTNIDKLEQIQDNIVCTIQYKFNAENRENIKNLLGNIILRSCMYVGKGIC